MTCCNIPSPRDRCAEGCGGTLCENCGLCSVCDVGDPETSNVVSLRNTHACASCGEQIPTERKYEGHAETCMQPEIRMRRAERALAQLQEVVHQLVASNNEAVESIVDLNKRLEACEALIVP